MRRLPTPRHAFLFLVSLFLVFVFGCQTLEEVIGSVDKPTAEITGVQLKDLSISAATLLFDVEVANPYSVPLPLAQVDYGLRSGEKQFLSGQADLEGTVPARQARTLSLPAKVNFLETLGVLRQFKPGAVIPYTADLGLSVDAPGVGPLRLPVSKEGTLPIPAVPTVQLEEIRWREISLETVQGVLRLHVTNRNEFPMNLSDLFYTLWLGDTQIASTGIEQSVAFAESGGAETLEIPIAFSAQSLGLAAFKMLTGEEAGYRLGGTMDVQTPFGPIRLPMEAAGNVLFQR